jgi:hypothetical protein
MSIYSLTQNYVPNVDLCSASLTSVSLQVCDADKETLYSLPSAAPANGDVMVFDALGAGSFESAASLQPNALVTAFPLVVPTAGSVCLFDGDSSVECVGSAILSVNVDDVKALYNGYELQNSQFGITANRPSTTSIGLQYFDTTLGYPIWFNGGLGWVNSNGMAV